jgi:hypothetical protein
VHGAKEKMSELNPTAKKTIRFSTAQHFTQSDRELIIQLQKTVARLESAIMGDDPVGQRGLVKRVYALETDLRDAKRDLISHARVEKLEYDGPSKDEWDDVKRRLAAHDRLIWAVGGGAVVVGFLTREVTNFIAAH